MIRGIGPVYARKLVRAFGEAVFEIIAEEPGRLREVSGIGRKRADRIIAGWAEQQVIREIMLFLHSNGVGTSRAVRIYKTYGADAVRLISENPYRLARDIRGIGFRTADQIAARLGIEKTALIRVRAGISFALAEAMDDGHCGLPQEELVALTCELLEVSADLVETAMGLELQDGAVIADDLDGRRCIFLAGFYRAEREIAAKLRALGSGNPPWPSIDADKAIPWVEKRTQLKLANSQIEAVRVALASKVLVITGGPGVGKTTLGQRDPEDPDRQECRDRALRADRSGRQAPVREHRARSQDDPSAARNRSQDGGLPPRRGCAARLRSARCRRDLDGRRAADAGIAARLAGAGGAITRRRR